MSVCCHRHAPKRWLAPPRALPGRALRARGAPGSEGAAVCVPTSRAGQSGPPPPWTARHRLCSPRGGTTKRAPRCGRRDEAPPPEARSTHLQTASSASARPRSRWRSWKRIRQLRVCAPDPPVQPGAPLTASNTREGHPARRVCTPEGGRTPGGSSQRLLGNAGCVTTSTAQMLNGGQNPAD